MSLTPLTAISPIDGRYWEKLSSLSAYFSEFALMKYRVRVEVEYFLFLTGVLQEVKTFPQEIVEDLRKVYQHFTEKDAEEIKKIEKITNHDIKVRCDTDLSRKD